MRFLLFPLLFVTSFLFSQNYIYHVKSLSYRDETSNQNKWHRLSDKNSIIIFDADSLEMNNEMVFMPTVNIYSNYHYQYYLLSVVLYRQTGNGDFSVDFDARDKFGNECDFSYCSLNKRKYFIIHYSRITLKYKLKKRVSISKKMVVPAKGEFE